MGGVTFARSRRPIPVGGVPGVTKRSPLELDLASSARHREPAALLRLWGRAARRLRTTESESTSVRGRKWILAPDMQSNGYPPPLVTGDMAFLEKRTVSDSA